MSEATELIGEVKASVARAERGIENFERDSGVVGAWTDLAQLRIAASRLQMFEQTLAARSVDLEQANTPKPEPAPEPAPEPKPEPKPKPAPRSKPKPKPKPAG